MSKKWRKNSSKFVYILVKQGKCPFNLTNFFGTFWFRGTLRFLAKAANWTRVELNLNFSYRPSNPESPEENFESPNPYDVNDDGRKEYSVLKDPEFSFGEYLEMQRMMNQFVHRKFSGSDEMLKKCEKTYDAFKDFWKTSGLRGHFVLFDNPNPTKIWGRFAPKNYRRTYFTFFVWPRCLKMAQIVSFFKASLGYFCYQVSQQDLEILDMNSAEYLQNVTKREKFVKNLLGHPVHIILIVKRAVKYVKYSNEYNRSLLRTQFNDNYFWAKIIISSFWLNEWDIFGRLSNTMLT